MFVVLLNSHTGRRVKKSAMIESARYNNCMNRDKDNSAHLTSEILSWKA